MGNNTQHSTARILNGFVSVLASFALASSLFAIPASAWAESCQVSGDTASAHGTSATSSDGPVISNAEQTADPAGKDADGGADSASAGKGADATATADASADGMPAASGAGKVDPEREAVVQKQDEEQRQAEEKGEPTFFDNVLEFFSAISPFSDGDATITNASFVARLKLAFPKEIHNNGAPSAQLILTGDAGTFNGNFIGTDTTGLYSAQITDIPAGTYSIKVQGTQFGNYEHDGNVTLKDGDLAELSLIDTLYTNVAGASAPLMGLLPYGDFNDDRAVDDQDSYLITRVLAEGAFDPRYDINQDGKVDISDVQYYAANVNERLSARSLRITKDVSRMGLSVDNTDVDVDRFDDTSAHIDGDSLVVDDEALKTLAYDDGRNVVLTPRGNANGVPTDIDDDNTVGFDVDTKNTDANTVIIKTPLDESGNPIAMPTSGIIDIYIKNDEPEVGQTPYIYYYRYLSETSEPRRSQPEPRFTLPEFEKNDYEFRENTKFTFNRDSGEIVLTLPYTVTIQRLVFEFSGTTDPSGKTVQMSQMIFSEEPYVENEAREAAVPEIASISADDRQIDAAWSAVDGAVGYDVEVAANDESEILNASAVSSLSVTEMNGKPLENGVEYSLRVRANTINDVSAWGESTDATPVKRTPPARPGTVALDAGYSQIEASWDAVDGASGYMLYFKDRSTEDYDMIEVEGTDDPRCVIGSLFSATRYDVYVVAKNEFGESEASDVQSASTIENGGKLPWYNLINRASQDASHYSAGDVVSEVKVAGNKGEDAWSVVDGNFNTYAVLPSETLGARSNDVSIAFKDAHSVRYLAFATAMADGAATGIDDIKVALSDADGSEAVLAKEDGLRIENAVLSGKGDDVARNAAYIILPRTYDNVKKVGVCFSRTNEEGEPLEATISEIAVYENDGFADKIDGLWADPTRAHVREGLTEAQIDALKDEVCAIDVLCNETHPLKDDFVAQIEAARDVLITKDSLTYDIDTTVTPSSAIGGLSAWQSLGASISAEKPLKVNVSTGNAALRLGDEVPVRLAYAQMGAGSTDCLTQLGSLKVGMNEISLKDVAGDASLEKGGTLYAEFAGGDSGDSYVLNVLNASEYPVLDLTGCEGDARDEAIASYVDELASYVNGIEKIHSACGHSGTGFLGMFDVNTCFANWTEIITDNVILSLPATDAYLNFCGNEAESRVAAIGSALSANDYAYDIAYKHMAIDAASLNGCRHLMRSVSSEDGAFGGIAVSEDGIAMGANEMAGLCATQGIVRGVDDAYVEGALFSDALTDAVVEQMFASSDGVSKAASPYIATLLTSRDANSHGKFDYSDVVSRVTRDEGSPLTSDMYAAICWQLHLAYDQGFTYSQYGGSATDGLFAARLFDYARDPESVGIGNSQDADCVQAFVKLACAAADRDLSSYFESWGVSLDDETSAYAQNFKDESRLIQYMDDDVHYANMYGDAKTKFSPSVAAATFDLEVKSNGNSSWVEISNIKASNIYGKDVSDSILGYEISRRGADSEDYALRGFVSKDDAMQAYCDDISDLTKEPYVYAVRAIDSTLGPSARTESAVQNANKASITNEGVILSDKSRWIISSSMDEEGDRYASANHEVSDLRAHANLQSGQQPAIYKAIDSDLNSVFIGSASQDSAAREVTIAFGGKTDVCGIIYHPGMIDKSFNELKVEISDDAQLWQTVALEKLYVSPRGNYKGVNAYENGDKAAIYFTQNGNSDEIAIHSAKYMRLSEGLENADAISIADIDVIARPQDSVSVIDENGSCGIGRLSQDLELELASGPYGSATLTIPEGSFVAVGRYAGNARYNAIVLRDADGNMISDPDNLVFVKYRSANGDVALKDEAAIESEGIWITYLSPEQFESRIADGMRFYPQIYRVGDSGWDKDAKLVYTGEEYFIPRQNVKDGLMEDLLPVSIDLGAYEAYKRV